MTIFSIHVFWISKLQNYCFFQLEIEYMYILMVKTTPNSWILKSFLRFYKKITYFNLGRISLGSLQCPVEILGQHAFKGTVPL